MPLEYYIWRGMLNRCRNPNTPHFKHYGSRGITVCDRWLAFEQFMQDMGPKPTPDHSIDRIDVNGNYEPSNCRWATVIEQMNNRRNTRYVEYQGQTLPLADVVREHGIVDLEIVRCRTERQGWSLERALSTPKQR